MIDTLALQRAIEKGNPRDLSNDFPEGMSEASKMVNEFTEDEAANRPGPKHQLSQTKPDDDAISHPTDAERAAILAQDDAATDEEGEAADLFVKMGSRFHDPEVKNKEINPEKFLDFGRVRKKKMDASDREADETNATMSAFEDYY